MNPLQTGPGVPGSFPLPNAAQQGTTYGMNKLHPSAQVPPRQNPINRGAPMVPRGGPAK